MLKCLSGFFRITASSIINSLTIITIKVSIYFLFADIFIECGNVVYDKFEIIRTVRTFFENRPEFFFHFILVFQYFIQLFAYFFAFCLFISIVQRNLVSHELFLVHLSFLVHLVQIIERGLFVQPFFNSCDESFQIPAANHFVLYRSIGTKNQERWVGSDSKFFTQFRTFSFFHIKFHANKFGIEKFSGFFLREDGF